MPSAAEMEVEACPVSKQSNGLSALRGKPLIPPYCRSVANRLYRPVIILCT